jgi:hypothetical protein
VADAPGRRHHPARVAAITGAVLTAAWAVAGSLSDWGAYWGAWIIAGLVVPELYGLAVNTRDTLSRNVWALERLDFGHPLDFAVWTPVHWAVAVVLWLLLAWLSVHLPFGWLR